MQRQRPPPPSTPVPRLPGNIPDEDEQDPYDMGDEDGEFDPENDQENLTAPQLSQSAAGRPPVPRCPLPQPPIVSSRLPSPPVVSLPATPKSPPATDGATKEAPPPIPVRMKPHMTIQGGSSSETVPLPPRRQLPTPKVQHVLPTLSPPAVPPHRINPPSPNRKAQSHAPTRLPPTPDSGSTSDDQDYLQPGARHQPNVVKPVSVCAEEEYTPLESEEPENYEDPEGIKPLKHFPSPQPSSDKEETYEEPAPQLQSPTTSSAVYDEPEDGKLSAARNKPREPKSAPVLPPTPSTTQETLTSSASKKDKNSVVNQLKQALELKGLPSAVSGQSKSLLGSRRSFESPSPTKDQVASSPFSSSSDSQAKKFGGVNVLPAGSSKPDLGIDRSKPTVPIKPFTSEPKPNPSPEAAKPTPNTSRPKPNSAFANRKLPAPPTESLADCAWYHGSISRLESRRLLNNRNGYFVVRDASNKTESHPYSLSLICRNQEYNLEIRKLSNGEYAIGKQKPGEKTYRCLQELIKYHQSKPIELSKESTMTAECILEGYPSRE